MEWTEVYIGLSSNLGDMYQTQLKALEFIKSRPDVNNLVVSKFYQTTPCYIPNQNNYLNAVCSFCTTLLPFQLLQVLQSIQQQLGQQPKPKNAPRLIDLDILFYGDQTIVTDALIVPHPRWSERLFVLRPLMDLTTHIGSVDLREVMRHFPNIHNETVLECEHATNSH